MKTLNQLALCLALIAPAAQAQTINNNPNQAGTANLPPPTTPQVTRAGANFNVWQWQTYVLLEDGKIATHTHSYTELASGLNYQGPSSGEWVPSRESIAPYAQGAIAQQGQHQIIFANNINSPGAIDEQTPDGKRLVSNIAGLMYYDPTTGQSVQIAEIQDSEGQLVTDNQVLYTNAFNGVKADVLLTYRRDGMEQDVVLRAQLPTPESFGLNSSTVELEVVTEFLNPPEANVWNLGMDTEGLEPDQAVSWGATSLGHGKAFSLDGHDASATVIKQYINLGGHYYLLEKVRFQEIQKALSSLPEQASNAHSLPGMASKELQLPKAPVTKHAARPIRLARGAGGYKGYVLDYVSLNTSYTNFTFQGDTTYYISGNVNLSGTNYFEGNTTIKYAANTSIVGTVGSQMIFLSAPYRPVVFTAKDDNTISENISGSTGSPSGYYANPAITLGSTGSVTLSDFRIAYASRGLSVSGTSPAIYDAQFVNSAVAVSDINGAVSLGNVLFSGVKTNFNATSSTNTISVANATFNNGFDLINGSFSNTTLHLTNCAFVNYTNLSGNISAGYNGFYQSPEVGSAAVTNSVYPLQRTGAASCYLTNGCAFLNAGTTNIDPNALKRIEVKTTYAPVVFTSYTITTATNLSIQAQRDTNSSPNLGYHYDPLDYAFGNTTAQSNLTFSAGTAAAWFYTASGPTYGLAVGDSATASFNGTEAARCYWVRYSMVQEGFDGNWTPESYISGLTGKTYTHAAPRAVAQFTTFSTPNTEAGPVAQNNGATYVFVFAGVNCEFYSGGIGGYYCSINVTNCLFVNGAPGLFYNYGAANYTMQGCTCVRGNVEADHTSGSVWPVTIFNCTFDQTTFYMNAHGLATNGYYTDYNSFRSGFETTTNLGGHDITNIVSYNWQSGSLGNYYLPTNSGVIDKGNTNANLLGLYQFTTQTNQMKETNSIVDLGYHYIATDANGNPLDSNGDGIPDYLEDANGNGLVDNGETNWALAIIAQPTNQTVLVGSYIYFSVGADGVQPVSYQWQFGGTNISGEVYSVLVLAGAQTNQSGTYTVVVTNAFGSITSTPAVLTVCTPTLGAISNQTVYAGSGPQTIPLTGISAGCSPFQVTGITASSGNTNLVYNTFVNYTNPSGTGSLTFTPSGTSTGAVTITVTLQDTTNNWIDGNIGISSSILLDPSLTYPTNWVMTNATGQGSSGVFTNFTGSPVLFQPLTFNPPILPAASFFAFTNNGIPYGYTATWSSSNEFFDGIFYHLRLNTKGIIHSPYFADTAGIFNGSTAWVAGQTSTACAESGAFGSLNQISESFTVTVVAAPLSVAIVSPTNQTFIARTNVTITAIASNSVPTEPVNYVQFFVGTNSLGYATSTNNIYQIPWFPSSGGTYVLTALAVNTNGLSAWSAPVTNYVKDLPSIEIINPVNGQIFIASPTNITVRATVVTNWGTIAGIGFFEGTNAWVPTNSGSPYTFTWTNVANGAYVLSAHATNNYGMVSISTNILITVEPTNRPPFVFAGPNQTNYLTTNAVPLNGIVSDDGLPLGSALTS
jgi:hypothetical protein